jgi:hypothetical protein
MLNVTKKFYAEYRYVNCQYAECRGAKMVTQHRT